MAECFAGGHLRFLDGEWRDDNGDVVEIRKEKCGEWITRQIVLGDMDEYKHTCSNCGYIFYSQRPSPLEFDNNYCRCCGVKMNTQ